MATLLPNTSRITNALTNAETFGALSTPTVEAVSGFVTLDVGGFQRILQPDIIRATLHNPTATNVTVGTIDGQAVILEAGGTVTVAPDGEPIYARGGEEITVIYIDAARSTAGTLTPVLEDVTELLGAGSTLGTGDFWYFHNEVIVTNHDLNDIFQAFTLNDFTAAYTYDPSASAGIDYREPRPDIIQGGTYFIGQDANTDDLVQVNPKTGDTNVVSSALTDILRHPVQPYVRDGFTGYISHVNTGDCYAISSDGTLIDSGSQANSNLEDDWIPEANASKRYFVAGSTGSNVYTFDFVDLVFRTYTPSGFDVTPVPGIGFIWLPVPFGNDRQNILKFNPATGTEQEFDLPTGTPDNVVDRASEKYFRALNGGDADAWFLVHTEESIVSSRYDPGNTSYPGLGVGVLDDDNKLDLFDFLDGRQIGTVEQFTGADFRAGRFSAYDPRTETLVWQGSDFHVYAGRLRFKWDPRGNLA